MGRVGGGIRAGHGGAAPGVSGPFFGEGRDGAGAWRVLPQPLFVPQVGGGRGPPAGLCPFSPWLRGVRPLEGLRWALLGPLYAPPQTPGPRGLWGPAEEGGVRPHSPRLPRDPAHAPAPLWASVSPSTETGCRVRCVRPGFRAGRCSPPSPRPDPARPRSPPVRGPLLCDLLSRTRSAVWSARFTRPQSAHLRVGLARQPPPPMVSPL